jgi:4-hydroxybenzoate polyprenyltransferase
MKNLLTYLNERFPLPVTGTHSLMTAMFLVAIAQPLVKSSNDYLSTVFIAISFLFFMLRMRVTDEFKDASHDSSNYPNRPVQRGIITKRQLAVIGVISLLLELSAAFAAGVLQNNSYSALFYLLILGYSVLTGFEFFIADYLEKHFNLYFLLHQAIFILYPIWVFNIFGTLVSSQLLLAASVFVLFMASMEIMRKYELRYDPAGALVMDTYLAVWRSLAFWLMFVINVFGPLALFTFIASIWLLVISGTACVSLLFFRKKNDAIRAIVALSFIATGLVIFFS